MKLFIVTNQLLVKHLVVWERYYKKIGTGRLLTGIWDMVADIMPIILRMEAIGLLVAQIALG
ncbi:hypothetical protein DWW90_12435 [Parabacteroides sp. AF17-28]|nr:hypothetical protein DWW90_12435 [Parabacteroides sp. AF17-28]